MYSPSSLDSLVFFLKTKKSETDLQYMYPLHKIDFFFHFFRGGI
jgi:hypothetical protein